MKGVLIHELPHFRQIPHCFLEHVRLMHSEVLRLSMGSLRCAHSGVALEFPALCLGLGRFGGLLGGLLLHFAVDPLQPAVLLLELLVEVVGRGLLLPLVLPHEFGLVLVPLFHVRLFVLLLLRRMDQSFALFGLPQLFEGFLLNPEDVRTLLLLHLLSPLLDLLQIVLVLLQPFSLPLFLALPSFLLLGRALPQEHFLQFIGRC